MKYEMAYTEPNDKIWVPGCGEGRGQVPPCFNEKRDDRIKKEYKTNIPPTIWCHTCKWKSGRRRRKALMASSTRPSHVASARDLHQHSKRVTTLRCYCRSCSLHGNSANENFNFKKMKTCVLYRDLDLPICHFQSA